MMKATLKGRSSASKAVRPSPGPMPSVPLAGVFSFLKDTRGSLTWTARELIETLKVGERDGVKIISILELQGYVNPIGSGEELLTTPSGETVSGSRLPRFSPESVGQALATLTERIAAINRDRRAEFKISKAVAFGDFLGKRSQVQAADVGIELRWRNPPFGSESDSVQERDFLKQLGRKSRLLHIRPYEKWMSDRSHRGLV